MNIYLKNADGARKKCPVGLSVTCLFFGLCVPLVGADGKGFAMFTIATALSIPILAYEELALVSLGVSLMFCWVFMLFEYNGFYVKTLLASGYLPEDELARRVLRQNGWIA